MKKTYNKLIFRGIKGTLNRFLSIFAIVALGSGFLAGLLSTSPDMKFTADKYFDAHNSYDINIKSTLGITDDDVSAILEQDGIEYASAAYVTDAITHDQEGETYTTRIFGADFNALQNDENYINKITLVEGRFPENDTECLLEIPNTYTQTHSIGDEIKIVPTASGDLEDDLYDTYNNLTYTVVGIVKSPAFISMAGEPTNIGSGKISLGMYIRDTCYSLEVYTDIFAEISGARELEMFTDEYKNLADDTITSLESFGEERAKIRYDSVIGEAQQKLDDAKQEFEDEKASAQQKLDDARKELDDAQKELADGRIKIADAEKTIADSETEIADGEIKIADAEAEIAEKTAEIADGRTQIAEAQAEIRANEADLVSGENQLADAQREYNEKVAEFNSGEAQINDAEAELDAAQAELDAVADQVAAAKTMIDAGFELSDEIIAQIQQYDAGVAQIEAGRTELEARKTELESARVLLNEGRAELDRNAAELQDARRQISEANAEIQRNIAELDDGERQIEEARAEIETKKIELADGKIELEDGKKELEEKKLELIDGEKKLADAEIEYSDAVAEYNEKIADAEEKIKDAEKKIKDIEKAEWIFFSREKGNAGFSKYDDDISKVAAISKVFPVFFFLVAALVALTTMTRMIDEDRPRIGALKSLGYRDGTILFYYCLYSGMASILGAAFGIIAGMKALPYVISSAYRMMYSTPLTETPINLGTALFVGAAIVSVILLTTVAACSDLLKERPAGLLVPKAPPSGKRIFLERITPLWKRLSFIHKVTARNLFRYRKRFMMTIIGIAGCSALLVTGFGIRDSISDIVDKQYNQIYRYDISLTLKNEKVMERNQTVIDYLNDSSQVDHWMLVHSEDAEIIKTGSSSDVKSVALYVPKNPDELQNSITMRNRKSKQEIEFGESSVVITEKLAEAMGVKIGDSVDITNEDGETLSFTVTGIMENYVSAYVYISPAVYAQFEEAPEYLNVLITAADGALSTEDERDEVTSMLLDSDGVVYCLHSETVRTSFADSVKSIDYIVIVLIVCAGALAVIVLYNLININICERKKELATIKVLGFFDSEVSSYIFRETNILAGLGCAFGLIGGIFLHMFVIRTVEVDLVMFGRSIYPLSYVYAAAITIAFTILVDLLMLKHLRNIDMVESMKAND